MKLDEIKIGMRVWFPNPYSDKYHAAKVVGIGRVLIKSSPTWHKRWLRYVKLKIRFGNRWYDTTAWARVLRKEKP